MDFSTALLALKNSSKIKREGWNDKLAYIEMKWSEILNRHFILITLTGSCAEWMATSLDILSDDWIIV